MFDWLNWFGFIDYDLNEELIYWLEVEKESLSNRSVSVENEREIYFEDRKY